MVVVVEMGMREGAVGLPRRVFEAVTLAVAAAVLFPLLARSRRAPLAARGVVARVGTFEALAACRSAAVALEFPCCARTEGENARSD